MRDIARGRAKGQEIFETRNDFQIHLTNEKLSRETQLTSKVAIANFITVAESESISVEQNFFFVQLIIPSVHLHAYPTGGSFLLLFRYSPCQLSELITVLTLLFLGIDLTLSLLSLHLQVTWKSKLKAAFPDPNNYSSFMGNFSTATGIVTLLMMLGGRLIFKKFGWGVAAMITPITLLTTGETDTKKSLIAWPRRVRLEKYEEREINIG